MLFRIPNPESRIPAAGFTLIELLVVIAIFGFLSLMAYGGLAAVLKSRAAVEASLDRTAQLQKAYQRLRNDFQQVRNRPVRDAYGQSRAALLGNATEGIEFTRAGWRNPLSLPRPALERVIYRLVEGKLLRQSYRVLDQAQDAKPVETPLIEGIEEATARYLDPATREWRDEWPPVSSTGGAVGALAPVPLAVEMTLETKDLGELRFLFRIGVDPAPAGFLFGQNQTGTTTGGGTSGATTGATTGGTTVGTTTGTTTGATTGGSKP